MPVTIGEVHVCIRIREILSECNEICKPETSIVKDTGDDSTSSHGDDSDTQDDDEDEDNDEDDLFDDNYGDDTDNELFLNGNADYLMHDGGWIREDDHVDCENNVDMDRGSNNNADGEVTSPTFVPNYHNKEMSTSMQKVGQESDIGSVDIGVNNVEASREESPCEEPSLSLGLSITPFL
ncbi:hypothetical protein Tco_1014922 [Tanacetum coccineum]